MAAHTFDPASFRLTFPAFADDTLYPDAMLFGYFDIAGCYIEPFDNPNGLSGNCLQVVLNLMTAHLVIVFSIANSGENQTGIVTTSTIDRVSVTQQIPQTRGAWQFFLARTAYGQQVWALLSVRAVGGFLVGGSCERQAVRGAGGIFGGAL
jgi:hypothetical protein